MSDEASSIGRLYMDAVQKRQGFGGTLGEHYKVPDLDDEGNETDEYTCACCGEEWPCRAWSRRKESTR